MKTRGIIAAWLGITDLAPADRDEAVLRALDRTLSGRSPQSIRHYRQELAQRLPECRLRSRVLETLDSKFTTRRMTIG